MPAQKGYGQFCPVAKAAEIIAERWTPLVLRELIAGSHHFNELRRGLPLMSSALLSQRLKELETSGIVERRTGEGNKTEYHLSQAGLELRPIIEALGFWGARWMPGRLTPEDYDPSLLMWDIHRNLDLDRLPRDRRIVVEFNLRGAEPQFRRWWLVVDHGEVDVCLKDPGYEVDLYVTTGLRALVEVWMGRQSIDAAVRAGNLVFEGQRTLAAGFRKSLKLSAFARAQLPAAIAPSERS
jgi:DNA-binding HxlR family transcriptional regulator